MSHTFNLSAYKLLNQCNNNPNLPRTFMSERLPKLINLFEQVEMQAHYEIEQCVVERTYHNGEYLRQANLPTRCLWMIECGTVLEEVDLECNSFITEFHFATEIVGNYSSYCVNHNNLCSLRAYGKVKCWEIPCEKIEEWVDRYESARCIVEILTEDYLYWQKNVLVKIKMLPSKDAFQYLHDHFPHYKRCISAQKLASFLNCSISTFNRMKSEYQSDHQQRRTGS